jgi:signal transduction histidine kinase
MNRAPNQVPHPADDAPAPAGNPESDGVLMRVGIQAKLVLSFMSLLIVALGGSWFLFAAETRSLMSHIMGGKAVEISQTLAMASETALRQRNYDELERIGKDLLKHRDVMTVAFFDDAGASLSIASKDLDSTSDPNFLPDLKNNIQHLMQVRHRTSKVLGDYAEVTAPVMAYPQGRTPLPPTAAPTGGTDRPSLNPEPLNPAPPQGARLLGYVVVKISEADQKEYVRRINVILAIVGTLVLLASLPIVSVLVHRIFMPIRQLVAATDRIAAGDLEAQVAIHRPDVIGTLARSFNAMVKKVRTQQEALESANDQLADANRDLEEKVLHRTYQLESANQRLSREIAEKEDFLRAVSHDLNAPLRNISGMATMLLMKHRAKFDEDVIHRLERIQKNVQIETDLIGELLELSRIKTRRQKMEPVDLNVLVGDLEGMLENDLRSKAIDLVIDNPLPVVSCERARMRQVFQNLIDNAIKYMGNGSSPDGTSAPVREIHVGCTTKAGEVEFYVRDTGIGIEPEDIDKVFCVFRRGKSAEVQSVAGKGIGLSSVKSIVETYSGNIWVESKPAKGSKFVFTLNGRHLAGDHASRPPERPILTEEEDEPATVGASG